MRKNIAFALCLIAATLPGGLRCEAAIYSRGKEVANEGKPVADVTRLIWVQSPNSAEKDRIQGHIEISVDDAVKSVLLVFQSFDSQGKLVTTFSLSPQTCTDHPSVYWAKQGTPPSRDTANRFPLCGVENTRIVIDSRNKRFETYKSGEKAWFYADSPRDKRVQSIRLVNVVIDDKEVLYAVRGSGNRLSRYTSTAPAIKHGTEATLGSEYSCKRWAPADTGASATTSTSTASSWGTTTQRQSTWGQSQSAWPSQRQGQSQSTWGQSQSTWGQSQGQSTWGQSQGGQSTWGQSQGQSAWGQGQSTWGQSQGQSTWGQGQSTWGQGQGQSQGPFSMPAPAKINVAPGAKVKLAAVEAGDIVVVQFMDGKCGRTVSGMMSPDDPESPVRPTLSFEQESYGQGRVKKGIDLLTGTKSAPQAVTAEAAGELFMELRATLMGSVTYRVWHISRQDSYSFYQTPVGKAVKSRPQQ